MYKMASCVVTIAILFALSNAQPQAGLTHAEKTVLDHPESIALQLKPVTKRQSAGVYVADAGPFKTGSTIKFELVGLNNSVWPLDVRSWDTYAQNQPVLLRNNQEMSYKANIAELLESKATDDDAIVHMFVIRVQAGEMKTLELFDLSHWYPSLGPGHYTLSIKHRFVQRGKLVQSSPISFEVQEK